MPAINDASTALGPLTPAQRTLALDKLLPGLRPLPKPELSRLLATITDLEAADGSRDAFEYALSREAGVFIADLLAAARSAWQDHARRVRAASCGRFSPWWRSTAAGATRPLRSRRA